VAEVQGAGSITGRVTDVDGYPLGGIIVDAYTVSGDWADFGYTDGAGAYLIESLSNGSYLVRTYAGESVYVDEWFDNVPLVGWEVATNAQAVAVGGGLTSAVNFALSAGGNVTGRVTAAVGGALTNVWVDAYAADGTRWRSGISGSNGAYAIYGAPAGYYFIRTDALGQNYANEWYDDVAVAGSGIPSGADAVSVVASQTTPNINFVLPPGAVLGGRVATLSGTPLQDFWVDVYEATAAWIESALTDAQGRYRISGLHAGSYYLRTYANGFNFADEWYNDVAVVGWELPTNAIAVALAAGAANTNVNFALAPGAVISGVVTASLGNGVADARIDVVTGDGDWVNSGETDTNGAYSVMNLPAGTFYARTDAGAVNLVDEWFDNVTAIGSEVPLGASPISLTSGAVRAGVNFGLDPGGGISGAVTDTNVLPLAGLLVDAYDVSSNWMLSATTAADGGYELLGLPPPGPYYLRTFDASAFYAAEWYNGVSSIGSARPAAASPIHVFAGGVAPGIDFVLEAGGAVTGRVTDALGAAIGGLDVAAYGAGYQLAGAARTAYDGTYSIGALPGGSFYVRTMAEGTNLVNEWFSDTPAVGAAIPAAADPVLVFLAMATGPVDFALSAGGVVSGRVTTLSLQPVANVGVNLYDEGSNWVKSAQTATSGAYAIDGLPSGIYRARSFAADAGYADEWYYNAPAPVSGIPTGAATLTVIAGATVAPVDFELARAGGFGGTVRDEAGSALAGIAVDAYAADGTWLGASASGGSGAYTVSGLAPGSYHVRTYSGAFAFRDEWYNNAPLAGASIPPGAAAVSVLSDATTPGVDFALYSDFVRAGRDGGVIWMVWPGASGTVYRVERSADLVSWAAAPDGTNVYQQHAQTGTVQDLMQFEDIHATNAVYHYRVGAGP
jgi:hypothetical protein